MDSQWLTNYCALDLQLPYPVLNAVSAYWAWVHQAVELYKYDPDNFPWDHYQDPNALLFIVRFNGCALRYVKVQTHQMCLAAVTQDARVLQFIHNPTPEMIAAANK
jgi:hypothetical protein